MPVSLLTIAVDGRDIEESLEDSIQTLVRCWRSERGVRDFDLVSLWFSFEGLRVISLEVSEIQVAYIPATSSFACYAAEKCLKIATASTICRVKLLRNRAQMH